MEQLDIQASNIKCGGCVNNIEQGLANFTGISEIKIDIESNVIHLQGENLDKALIAQKLSELGYPLI